MRRITFSNIFSMIVIAAVVLIFGDSNVKADTHHGSLIGGEIALHLGDDLRLDKSGKNHLKKLQLRDQHLLLLDKIGLKTDKIADLKKLDILKDAKLNLKPDVLLDDLHLLKSDSLNARLDSIKLADHLQYLSLRDKDAGLAIKTGLLSAHLKSGLLSLVDLENKLILDNKSVKLGKHELKPADKNLGEIALGIDKVLVKKSLLKDEKISVFNAGLDKPVKNVLFLSDKGLLTGKSNDLKDALDVHGLALKDDRVVLDNSIVKSLAHTFTADHADGLLVNAVLNDAAHKSALTLKQLKIENLTLTSALPSLGGADSILGLDDGLVKPAAELNLVNVASKKNKIRKEVTKNVEWQWTNNPISVLNAMKWWFTDKDAALKVLKEGQASNPAAQRSYDLAAAELSDFWSIVSSGSPQDDDDSTAIEAHLKWQQQNEWSSLNSSRESWNALPRNEDWAYYNLLWGQRQNWEALRSYRSGWSKNKSQVMAIVDSIWKKQ